MNMLLLLIAFVSFVLAGSWWHRIWTRLAHRRTILARLRVERELLEA
jgi:hypothetical protein